MNSTGTELVHGQTPSFHFSQRLTVAEDFLAQDYGLGYSGSAPYYKHADWQDKCAGPSPKNAHQDSEECYFHTLPASATILLITMITMAMHHDDTGCRTGFDRHFSIAMNSLLTTGIENTKRTVTSLSFDSSDCHDTYDGRATVQMDRVACLCLHLLLWTAIWAAMRVTISDDIWGFLM